MSDADLFTTAGVMSAATWGNAKIDKAIAYWAERIDEHSPPRTTVHRLRDFLAEVDSIRAAARAPFPEEFPEEDQERVDWMLQQGLQVRDHDGSNVYWELKNRGDIDARRDVERMTAKARAQFPVKRGGSSGTADGGDSL